MKIRNLVYLAQLEEYNPKRISDWLRKNPKKNLIEIKKKLIFTHKTIMIFGLTKIISIFTNSQKAIIYSLNILNPIYSFIKLFLIFLAKIKLIIFHSKLKTIAITGSWGKTTSKEILWELLKEKYKSEKTTGNQNTLIGISIKILKLPINTEIFVCEIGAYKIGEIKKVCQLLRPQIGIITAIGPMHLERFGSIKNIKTAKLEIINSLPKSGKGFIPKELIKEKKIITHNSKNIYYFSKISEVYKQIGDIFNISTIVLEKTIKKPPIIKHRQEMMDTGIVKIIDNSYNSNPLGFKMAVDKLFEQKTKIKIIITPGMIELGNLSFKENYKAAKYASQKCTHAIIVGDTNKKALINGFKNSKKIKIFTANSQNKIDEIIQKTIIIKNI
jgi:UDP-N-acetylmuramoyl-tripeptide--D-alanyl-D-alanine ligase